MSFLREIFTAHHVVRRRRWGKGLLGMAISRNRLISPPPQILEHLVLSSCGCTKVSPVAETMLKRCCETKAVTILSTQTTDSHADLRLKTTEISHVFVQIFKSWRIAVACSRYWVAGATTALGVAEVGLFRIARARPAAKGLQARTKHEKKKMSGSFFKELKTSEKNAEAKKNY